MLNEHLRVAEQTLKINGQCSWFKGSMRAPLRCRTLLSWSWVLRTWLKKRFLKFQNGKKKPTSSGQSSLAGKVLECPPIQKPCYPGTWSYQNVKKPDFMWKRSHQRKRPYLPEGFSAQVGKRHHFEELCQEKDCDSCQHLKEDQLINLSKRENV